MTEEEEACYNLITGRLDMSYSIYVLAVNQETPVYADFLSRIILHNEIDDYDTMGIRLHFKRGNPIIETIK